MLFLAYLEQTTTNEVCHYLKRNNQEPTQRSTTYVKLRTCAPPWMHGHRNRSAPEEWRPSERSDVSVTKTQYCNISPSDLKYAVQIVKWNNSVLWVMQLGSTSHTVSAYGGSPPFPTAYCRSGKSEKIVFPTQILHACAEQTLVALFKPRQVSSEWKHLVRWTAEVEK